MISTYRRKINFFPATEGARWPCSAWAMWLWGQAPLDGLWGRRVREGSLPQPMQSNCPLDGLWGPCPNGFEGMGARAPTTRSTKRRTPMRPGQRRGCGGRGIGEESLPQPMQSNCPLDGRGFEGHPFSETPNTCEAWPTKGWPSNPHPIEPLNCICIL